MRTPAPQPTFEVRFIGNDIYPESIPLRDISEALSAVQRLASGKYAEEDLEQSDSIGLMAVKRGSAVFKCVANRPTHAIRQLKGVGNFVEAPSGNQAEHFGYALKPLHRLSDIARSLKCRIVVRARGDKSDIASFESESYHRVSKAVLVSGTTTVTARVERVGGSTDTRCILRVKGLPRVLFCDVASQPVAKDLAQHLYEDIRAYGTATWLCQTWKLVEFKLESFTVPKRGSILQGLNQINEAGGKAWEKVADPRSILEGLR